MSGRDIDEVDVLVAGAGLAGLTTAAVAAGGASPPPEVMVVDTRSVGGRARTDRRGDFLFNQGPRALYRGGLGRAVLGRLGLTPHGGPPPLSSSYAWHDGRVERLPDNGSRLATSSLLGVRSRARLGLLLSRLGRIDARALGDRSTQDWIDSLELRPDAQGLVTMLTRVATYTPDLSVLSADAGVRQLQLALVDGVDYLDGGWQQLVDGLADVAERRGVEVRTGARVTSLAPAPAGDRWLVGLGDGREVTASSVVLALGSPAATAAVLGRDPGWELGADATAACLDLGLARVPARPVLFGLERPLYLSTHAPAARLAPPGRSVVHAMRYGARTAEGDAAELWELATAAGIEQADVITDRFLRRMVVAHSLPRPGVGLDGRPAVAVAGFEGVFVAGDWVGPAGLLADASLASAETAGQLAARHAPRRGRHPGRDPVVPAS